MKRSPIRRQSKKHVSESALRAACRKYIVELRDLNTCQRCGRTDRKLEWAHVMTRDARSLIYVPWNSLALCGPRINIHSCHGWFDSNKEAGLAWWEQKFPARAVLLQHWRHAHPVKVTRAFRLFELQWLRQRIEDHESEAKAPGRAE